MGSNGSRQFARGIALLISSLLVCACMARPQVVASPTSEIPTMVMQPSATVVIPTMVFRPPVFAVFPTSTTVPPSLPESFPTPDPQASPEGAALVGALRQGGYVIYFRHATADRPEIDTETQILRECSRQGNLIQQGRDEACHWRGLSIAQYPRRAGLEQ